MQFTAQQIALMVQGRLEGNPETAVSAFGKIEEAQAGQLSFLANPKYEEHLYTTGASIVIVSEQLELKQKIGAALIRVADPYTAFATLMAQYQKMAASQLTGIQEPCFVSPSSKMGQAVFIGAFVYIGEDVEIGDHCKIHPGVYLGKGVKIGAHTILHPGVKIYHDCVVGQNVIIHAGAVLGGDGFGFAPQPDGSFQKVPQLGNVVVEDGVEIGANTTIDRATLGSTLIRKGAKLDNLIQIAHNVEVGKSTVIAAQTGVSGSTKIGNFVMIGGQTGIAGHISIADGSKINGQSGVTKSIKEPNKSFNGNPAFDFSQSRRVEVSTRRLPELEKRVKELENLVQQLLAEKEVRP